MLNQSILYNTSFFSPGKLMSIAGPIHPDFEWQQDPESSAVSAGWTERHNFFVSPNNYRMPDFTDSDRAVVAKKIDTRCKVRPRLFENSSKTGQSNPAARQILDPGVIPPMIWLHA
jgi:hypothetical protein